MRVSTIFDTPVTQAEAQKAIELLKKKKNQILSYPFAKLGQISYDYLKPKLKPYQHFDHLCIVGLGGSSLGTKMLFQALGVGEVTFLDNVDPYFVQTKLAHLDAKKTLFICVSKSGETIEVVSLFHILWKLHSKSSSFLVITDETESTLGEIAARHKIQVIPTPRDVSGRFSLFTPVSMVPALIKKIPIKSLMQEAGAGCFMNAARIASMQYAHAINGRSITPVFAYCERLSSFVDWYIQLLAESIGKTSKIGCTPLKAIGVKDQHAQLQLFLDGPDDKCTIFIRPLTEKRILNVPKVDYTLNELFLYEYEGVLGAFQKRNRPSMELTLGELNEKELGEFIFTAELSVACLGLLFGVDFQTQPAVELSKTITKKLLYR